MATPDFIARRVQQVIDNAKEQRRVADMLRNRQLIIDHLIPRLKTGRLESKKNVVKREAMRFATQELRLSFSDAEWTIKNKTVQRSISSATLSTDAKIKSRATRLRRCAKQMFAASLRTVPTESEAILFEAVQKRYQKFRFKSNVVLSGFIPDIYSEPLCLIIEVDGSSHIGREDYDAKRDRIFQDRGIQTVRIPAATVFSDLPGVMEKLDGIIAKASIGYKRTPKNREKLLRRMR